MAIVAFHGDVSTAVWYLNMPMDPLQRHNIIIGPKMGKRAVDTAQVEIKPCEKPAYLAECILRRLTKPGDTVIVTGFGAGGDLKGALNAGCHVLVIEQDTRQFNAVKRMLPMFKPKSDLSMVIQPAMINFGFEWSERLGPYTENFDKGSFECHGCSKEWPGCGSQCPVCDVPCCLECLPADTERCMNCAIIRDELARLEEKEAADTPALAENAQE